MPIRDHIKWGQWSSDEDIKREGGCLEDSHSPYVLQKGLAHPCFSPPANLPP